ncbi:hypothetical protein SASPL_108449 [Salvia splendens]|uniref:Uncharacterized protein n=1 Tax=Salvia splendens TaxID=180675 RepID=A0A8X8YER9_SALSN|nr:hypothetical protein SASPL_108449 [Salvia splendens]
MNKRTNYPMSFEELFSNEVLPEDTNEHLKTLSTRIGYDFDLSAKRAEIFNQLGVGSGLTLKHKFFVGQKLVKEPELRDLF